MNKSLRWAALSAAVVFTASCAATDPGDDPSAEGGSETVTLCAAFSDSPAVKDLPALIAFEALEDDGIVLDVQPMDGGAAAVQTVVSGQCDIGFNGSFGGVLAANEAGASLRIVGVNTYNEFSMVAKGSIDDMEQLEGVRYGTFTELSYDKALAQAVLGEAGIEPSYVVAGGSDERGPALIAGQLDATGLDLATIVALRTQGQDDFNVLVDFKEAIPGLMTTVTYAQESFLAENADVVKTIMAAIQESYAANGGDVTALAEMGAEKIEGWSDEADGQVVEAYVDLEMWPAEQSELLNEDSAEISAELYKAAGNITEIPPVESYLDTQFIEGTN
jgi:ABC-type nitrate/sulfonate/bicarbonate transport system substrate-binding protein